MTHKVGVFGNFCLLFKTYKGFTSRQLIPFEAIITNKHKYKIKRIEVCLIKVISSLVQKRLIMTVITEKT